MDSRNNSIKCNVNECKFHNHSTDYCTLNQIQVSKHKAPATDVEATDCASFKPMQ